MFVQHSVLPSLADSVFSDRFKRIEKSRRIPIAIGAPRTLEQQ